MCLYIKLTQTLKKPLRVYKVLNTNMRSSVYQYKYDFNKANYISRGVMFNKAGIVDTIFTLWAAFHEGFHSWRSLKSALFSLDTDSIIFEAEIPAGAEVAFGRDGDIVSTELIVKPYCYIPVKVFGMTFFRRIKYHQK